MRLLNKTFWMGTIAALALGATSAMAFEESDVVRNRSIGFVTTDLHWAVYQTPDGKEECPNGLAGNGPREVFKQLYPNLGPVEKTQLAREALKYFPQDQKGNQFPYIEAVGKHAIGLNLDGKVGSNDYEGPNGEKGIDNNLQKVIGCNAQYRGPEGQLQLFANKQIPGFGFVRTLIELTNVDSLVNDDDVDVTIYRGRDPMLNDASGEKVAPGGSQRIDMRYGKKLIQHFKGKIENGVLTTKAADGQWPWQIFPGPQAVLKFHDMQFSMKLSPDGAHGLLAGYADVESYYKWLISWSTHHLSYGRLEAPEFYWELRKNADAYPDPKDGHMTAISSAIKVDMAQVFIQHDDDTAAPKVAQVPAQKASAPIAGQ
jgi:hypothetical protein